MASPTGALPLQLPLIGGSGPNGVSASLELEYSSAIYETVTSWNTDAPTGVAGLGWHLPLQKIIRTPRLGGEDAFGLAIGATVMTFALVETTSPSPGTTIRRFVATEYKFWRIEQVTVEDPSTHVLKSSAWQVVSEVGLTTRFGGDVQQGADGNYVNAENAIEWTVTWGGWVGPSTRVWLDDGKQQRAQRQEATAWYITSLTQPTGGTVSIQYDQDQVTVGAADGLAYTKAVYLKRVEATPGFRIELTYKQKNLASECPPDRSVAGVSLYQDRYESLYLSQLTLFNNTSWSTERVGYVVLDYGSTLLNQQHPTMAKRLLRNVSRFNADGVLVEPSEWFNYYGDEGDTGHQYVVDAVSRQVFSADPGAKDGGLFGALRERIDPMGGVTRFAYAEDEIGGSALSTTLVLPGDSTSDVRVLNCGVYTLVITDSVEKKHYLNVRVLSFEGGQWRAAWEEDIEYDPLGSHGRPYAVAPGPDYFVLLTNQQQSRRTPAMLVSRSRMNQARWTVEAACPVGVDLKSDFGDYYVAPSAWRCAAGEDVAAVVDPAGNRLYRYRRQRDRWVMDSVPIRNDTTTHASMAVAAGSDWIWVVDLLVDHSGNFDGRYRPHFVRYCCKGESWLIDREGLFTLRGWENPFLRDDDVRWQLDVRATGTGVVVNLGYAAQRAPDNYDSYQFATVLTFSGRVIPLGSGKLLYNRYTHDAAPQTSFSVASGTIRLSTVEHTHPHPGSGITYAFLYDGVDWQEKQSRFDHHNTNVIDLFALNGAERIALDVRGVLRDDFQVLQYNAKSGQWSPIDGLSIDSEWDWFVVGQLAQIIFMVVSMPVPVGGLLVRIGIEILVNTALQVGLSLLLQKLALDAAMRAPQGDSGDSTRFLLFANADDNTLGLWTRDPSTDLWKRSETAPLGWQMRTRILSVTEEGVLAQDHHDNLYLCTVANGALQQPQLLRANFKGVHTMDSGVIANYRLESGRVHADLYRVVRGRTTGAVKHYVIARTSTDSGYQTLTTRFSYDPMPQALPYVAAQGLTASVLYNRTASTSGPDGLAGTTENYFYNGRDQAMPFEPQGSNARDYPLLTASSPYCSRSLNAQGTPVASNAFVLHITEKHPELPVFVTLGQSPRNLQDADGVATEEESTFDLDVSGQILSLRSQVSQIAREDDDEIQVSGSVYCWGVPAYASAFKAANFLTPRASGWAQQTNVPALHPDARLAFDTTLSGTTLSDATLEYFAHASAEAGKLFQGKYTDRFFFGLVRTPQSVDITAYDMDEKGAVVVSRPPTSFYTLIPGTGPVLTAHRPSGSVFATDFVESSGSLAGVHGVAWCSPDFPVPAVLWVEFRDKEPLQPGGAYFDGEGAGPFEPDGVHFCNSYQFAHIETRQAQALQPYVRGVSVPIQPGYKFCSSPIAGPAGPNYCFAAANMVGGPIGALATANIALSGQVWMTPLPLRDLQLGVMKVGPQRKNWLIFGVGRDLVANVHRLCLVLPAALGVQGRVVALSEPLPFVPKAGGEVLVQGQTLYVLSEVDALWAYSAVAEDESGASYSFRRLWSRPYPMAGMARRRLAVDAAGNVVATANSSQLGRCLCIAVSPAGETAYRYGVQQGRFGAPVASGEKVLLPTVLDASWTGHLMGLAEGVHTAARAHKVVTVWDPLKFQVKAVYHWDGTGSDEFTWWTGDQKPPSNWQLDRENIVIFGSEPVESINGWGLTESLLLDRDRIQTVATFRGASYSKGEAFYCGFETYENEAFTVQKGAVSEVRSFTGDRALQLDSGGVATRLRGPERKPLGRVPGRMVVEARVRSEGGASQGAVGRLVLTLQRGNETPTIVGGAVSIVATEGGWTHVTGIVDVDDPACMGQFLGLAIYNDSANALWIDDVFQVPLDCGCAATVFDAREMLPTALFANGAVRRQVYDEQHRMVASVGPDGVVGTLSAGSFSCMPLEGGWRSFDPLSPNASTDVMPAGVDSKAYRFRDPGDLDGWATSSTDWEPPPRYGLRLASGQSLARPASGTASCGVRAQMRPLQEPPGNVALSISGFKVECIAGSGGSCQYTLSGPDERVSFAARWCGDWMLIVLVDLPSPGSTDAKATVYFYADGVRTPLVLAGIGTPWQRSPECRIDVAAGEGLTPWVVRDVCLFSDPAMAEAYSDGEGLGRQAQAHEGATLVVVSDETLYDSIGRETFEILPARKFEKGTPRSVHSMVFEPWYVNTPFINARDPLAGAELWSTSMSNPMRARLPDDCLAVVWRRHDEPELGDQAAYGYAGRYYGSDPLDRPEQTTSSAMEYSYGRPHATQYGYERTAQARNLMSIGGITDPSSFSADTSTSALSDTEKEVTIEISDSAGRCVAAGTGYGSDPFGVKPDGSFRYAATQTRTAYDREAKRSMTALPNYFLPRKGSDGGAFVQSRTFDYWGRMIQGHTPDAGASDLIYDIADRICFARNARGIANGFFVANTYDRTGRLYRTSVVAGVPWDADALSAVAMLPHQEELRELLGHWPLREGVGSRMSDLSGRGAHAHSVDAQCWSLDAPSGRGHSLSLHDGSGTRGLRIDRPDTGARPGGVFSITASVRTRAQGVDQFILCGTDPDGGWCGLYVRADGALAFGAMTAQARHHGVHAFVSELDRGEWISVAGVHDANCWTLYVNGRLAARMHDRLAAGSHQHWMIGARPISATECANGLVGSLRDVRFYGRELAAAEALRLHIQAVEQVSVEATFDQSDQQALPFTWARVVTNTSWSIEVPPGIAVDRKMRWPCDEGSGLSQPVALPGVTHGRFGGEAGWAPHNPRGAGLSLRCAPSSSSHPGTFATHMWDDSPPRHRPLALSAWVFLESSADGQVLVSDGDDHGSLTVRMVDGTLQAGHSGSAAQECAALDVHPHVGRWVHVVASFDGSHWTLFLDGAVARAASASSGSARDHQAATRRVWTLGKQLHGCLWQVDVYARAFDAADVSALVRESIAQTPDQGGVVVDRYEYTIDGLESAHGRRVPQFGPQEYVIRRSYDNHGRMTRMTVPSKAGAASATSQTGEKA